MRQRFSHEGRHGRHAARVALLAFAAAFAVATTARAQPHLPLPPPPPLPHPPVPVPSPPPVTVQVQTSPPPYYTPAPQAAPPPYYAPPAQPSGPPDVIYTWTPDDPIPEGYKPVSKPNSGLIGIGSGMLSAGWATAVVTGALAADAAAKNGSPNGVGPDDWVPMYFPVAGPLIAISTTKQGPAGIGLMLCAGIFQTGGLLAILIGSLRQTHRLVREPAVAASIDVDIAPAVSPDLLGVTTTGHF